MGIRTEYQAVITCDACGDNWIEAYWTQKEAIKGARKDGWFIGKRVTCPKCQPTLGASLSERIKAGMNEAKMAGKHIGRPRLEQLLQQ